MALRFGVARNALAAQPPPTPAMKTNRRTFLHQSLTGLAAATTFSLGAADKPAPAKAPQLWRSEACYLS